MPKELPISEAQAAFRILKNPTTQKYAHKKTVWPFARELSHVSTAQ